MCGSELRNRDIRYILGYLHSTLSLKLCYEAFVLGFSNFTKWQNIYFKCTTLRLNFYIPKNGGVRQIWDISGLCYSTERLRFYRDGVRTTLWKLICKGIGVRKKLWERRCKKDVVRETLWDSKWEKRCEKDVVRNSLWDRYLFGSASFNRQIFVIKNVLHRLGALRLWCLRSNYLSWFVWYFVWIVIYNI